MTSFVYIELLSSRGTTYRNVTFLNIVSKLNTNVLEKKNSSKSVLNHKLKLTKIKIIDYRIKNIVI